VDVAEAVRLIAFYLPQYHPIPENDRWWGEGFTEWTNVTRAQPLFPGHHQPHLPADLGLYDLRLAEVRQAQADLARGHGIHGFCYYHYWFHGRRLLHRPLDEVLASRAPDFPFCLCWANEPWTRSWDGLERDVLVEQRYSDADDRRHGRWLTRVFADRRYLRVDGKPVFLVYRAGDLPDAARAAAIWREEAVRAGIGEVFLCAVESLHRDRVVPAAIGFDATVEFQPDWLLLPEAVLTLGEGTRVYEYGQLVDRMLEKPRPDHRQFRGVATGWDNTARRQRDAVVLQGSTPDLYGHWLAEVLRGPGRRKRDENLVFINAWNEWGEGAHLEPCREWGRRYLEATRAAVSAS
jgi:lipopolysaccharide biosynthesis protein